MTATIPQTTPTLEQTHSESLQERAMLVAISIKGWSPRKVDAQTTNEVAQQKQVQVSAKAAGHYTKNLIPKSNAFERIKLIVGTARAEVYNRTLPWAEDGARIISPELWFQLASTVNKLESDWKQAVEEFLTEYPNLVKQAQTDLGDLYSGGDYPTVDQLRERFVWRLSVYPLPSGRDFRVNLGDEVTTVIKAKIEAEVRASVEASQRESWEKLATKVKHMAERLDDPKTIFRDSLVDGLKDVAETAKKLNVVGDSQLEQTIAEIETKLLPFTPDELRKDNTTRATVVQDAKAIFASMQAFLGGSSSSSEEGV
jgi:hypothetical protein